MIPYAPWLVWIIPTFSSIFVPLIARFSGKTRNYFAVLASLVTIIFAFSMIPDVYFNTSINPESTAAWIPTLAINAGVFIDSLSVMFANLIAFFGLVITIYSLGYMAGEEGLTRYYFFMLLFIGSMIGLVMSDNFLQMFIFWEMVGLCSYSLISFWYKRPEAVRAGTKVFLMTRIGDICLLAAIALLYTSLGSFSFSYTISNIGTLPIPTLTAVAFLMLGAAVAKSAQLPLHTWLYSAMEAPTSVSALLHAATMVKAGVFLIARLFTLFALFPLVLSTIPMWLPSLIWIGAITAFIGGTLALYTTDIKGVGAYSTISQIGFMMATLGAAPSSSAVGWFAGLFHLTNHAFFQGLDFLAIGGIIHAVGSRDMRLMGGLRKAMPITFSFSMVVMLARTGIPPFSSFFSKELIIDSLSSAGSILLMVIIYATTALTFAYSLRFIVLVYLRDLSAYLKKIRIHEPSKIMLFSSGIVAIMCVCLVLFIDPFAKFMNAGFEMGLTQVFSPSTLLFAIVLFLGGLPVYLAYYRKSPLIEKIRKTVLGPVSTVLEHGYFFDDFYERVVANGIVRISEGIHNVEAVFELLPQLTARAITGLAYGAHKYFDVFADELLYIMANRALALGSRIGKTHNQSLQRYLVAALLGFLILLILVIATMWAMR